MEDYNNLEQKSKKDNTTKILIAIVSVLAIIVVIMAVYLIYLNKQNVNIEKENTEISEEKEILKKQLQDLYSDYDELEASNDSLNAAISKEKEHIETLISELDRIKNYSYSIKKKYDDEISSLKKIMRSYVFQIDSLDQLNKKLVAENVQIKDQHQQTKKELEYVVEEKEELQIVLESASVLKTASITTKFLTNKNKETAKTRKVEKLEIDFVIVSNNLAEAGAKRIYLRIIRPDGFVISDGGTFTFRENNIAYTEYRDVTYEKENLAVAIFHNVKEKLTVGIYNIELYYNGEIIGKSSFNIEK
ncbi:MAG: hypothetical protein LBV69_04315 [Bacteroidales bacterium]|jgi:peptidoglycan hydrolase CwlO-like protein|nr:hypothetical protein [Bacteroidales bacterium]